VNTRKKLFVALSIALAFVGLLGCGTSNHLQTITLSAAGTSGLFNVKGEGGTLQLVATGNYSSSKTHDLTNVVTYTMTASGSQIASLSPTTYAPLPAPPQTATMSKTGLVTAVQPFACTWHDGEPNPNKDNKPSWFLAGSYQVVATYQGVTSQPVFVGVASAAGDGPSNACGP
jgi:hypothetical protein